MPLAPTPIVTVCDDTYQGDEPFLGAARYSDGSLIVIAYRTPSWAPLSAGSAIYRTRGTDTCWQTVWTIPRALETFITTHPVGAVGKISNRRVEVVDLAAAVPTARIVIARGPGMDNWVGY